MSGLLRRLKSKRYIILIIFFAFILISALLVYQNKKTALKGGDELVALNDSAKLLNEVGEIIDLPKNETPTIATISNADEVRKQKFFAEAKNGDKLIVYTASKKAILYRPGEGVINVANVNIALPSPAKKSSESATLSPTIVNSQ